MEKENQNLIYNGYNFQTLTEKITQGIYRDELEKMQKHTRENPMYYGNVPFWLKHDENGCTLIYTVHPKNWDLNSIIVDLELEDQKYYEQKLGFNFDWDVYGQH